MALALVAAIALTILVNFIVLGRRLIENFLEWRKSRIRLRKDVYKPEEIVELEQPKLKSDSTIFEEMQEVEEFNGQFVQKHEDSSEDNVIRQISA